MYIVQRHGDTYASAQEGGDMLKKTEQNCEQTKIKTLNGFKVPRK